MRRLLCIAILACLVAQAQPIRRVGRLSRAQGAVVSEAARATPTEAPAAVDSDTGGAPAVARPSAAPTPPSHEAIDSFISHAASGVGAEEDAATGGWQPNDDTWSAAGIECRLPIVGDASQLSPSAFRRLYRGKHPIIFRSAASNVTAARRLYTKSELLRRFGHIPVHACNAEGTGPMRGCQVVQLQDWVETLREHVGRPGVRADELQYLFNSGRRLEDNFPELVESWPVPPQLHRWFPGQGCFVNQLCVGQPQAGLPFHWHMAVHGHEVLYGRKRWWLSEKLPPGGVNPKVSSLEWLTSVYPGILAENGGQPPKGLFDCTLHQGDVLYLPAGWYHATLNLDELVSMTYQCKPPEPGAGFDAVPTDLATAMVSDSSLSMDEYRFRASGPLSSSQQEALMMEALAKHPDEPEFHYHLAVALANAADESSGNGQKLVGALLQVDEAIALNPHVSTYHTLRARLRDATGDAEGALESLNLAVELDPNDVATCVLRADTLLAQRQRKAAVRAYVACVKRCSGLLHRADANPQAAAEALRQLNAAMDGLSRLQTTDASAARRGMLERYDRELWDYASRHPDVQLFGRQR